MERLLAKAGERDTSGRARQCSGLCGIPGGLPGQYAAQMKYGREAAELAEAAGEAGKPALRWALAAQAYAGRAAGDFQTELALGERVIQLNRQSGDVPAGRDLERLQLFGHGAR